MRSSPLRRLWYRNSWSGLRVFPHATAGKSPPIKRRPPNFNNIHPSVVQQFTILHLIGQKLILAARLAITPRVRRERATSTLRKKQLGGFRPAIVLVQAGDLEGAGTNFVRPYSTGSRSASGPDRHLPPHSKCPPGPQDGHTRERQLCARSGHSTPFSV